MNEKIATYLALIFLLGVGFFNVVYVLSNLRKRKVRKLWLWLRMIGGLIVLGICAYFIYRMRVK